MANIKVNVSRIEAAKSNIFNAIKEKDPSTTLTANDLLGESDGITSKYAAAIKDIPTGGSIYEENVPVTPSETAQQVIPESPWTPQKYDGLSLITVAAITPTYVGSGVIRRNSSDLTTSGATVIAPAGYYETAAEKAVDTAEQAEIGLSLDSTNGKVTGIATQSAGYVVAGSKSSTLSLSTAAAAIITPSTSAQTAVAAGKYTLGAITVAAIQTETTTATINNTTYTPTAGKYFSSVTVKVPTYTPTYYEGEVSS